MRGMSVSRELWTLLWKEWREGWALALVLVCLVVGLLALRPVGEGWGDLAQVGLLCLGAAVVGARPLAGEAEADTLRFLMSRPVSPALVWRAKLEAGAASVAALYLPSAVAEWVAPSRAAWAGELPPVTLLLPLVAFALAFFLSAAVDNTALAFVGGVVGVAGCLALVRLLLLLGDARGGDAASEAEPMVSTVVGALALAWVALFLAAGYWVFRTRVKC